MSLSVGEGRTETRLILDIKTENWLTPEALSWALNEGNQYVLKRCMEILPSGAHSSKAITYPANAQYIDWSGGGYLNLVPAQTRGIDWVQDPKNPIRLRMGNFQERDAPVSSELCYTIQQTKLWLYPIPTTDIPLVVHYIPTVAKITSATAANTALLGGLYPEYQQYVPWAAAQVANVRDRGSNQAITARMQELERDLARVSYPAFDGPMEITQTRSRSRRGRYGR